MGARDFKPANITYLQSHPNKSAGLLRVNDLHFYLWCANEQQCPSRKSTSRLESSLDLTGTRQVPWLSKRVAIHTDDRGFPTGDADREEHADRDVHQIDAMLGNEFLSTKHAWYAG